MNLQESLDIPRLHRALDVEAESGFQDLAGRQYHFSEFMHLTLADPPVGLSARAQETWRDVAAQFVTYPQMTASQRQRLVMDVRQLLRDLSKAVVKPPVDKTQSVRHEANPSLSVPPRTTRLAQEGRGILHRPATLTLDQPLTTLPGIGPRNGEKLTRLGLRTVKDLLYYYPRDHIDYARQVNIRELQEGTTVTLIATVKRCNCFTSPRNKNLTIFELVVQDRTGQIKLNRFYAGSRFSNPAWQQQQKKLYSIGAVVAASGLVKQSKFGMTLEDPDLEVLDHPGGTIESVNIGRIVPVYPLTDGVPADLVRRAIIAALPAAQQFEEPLPTEIRDRYELVDLTTAVQQIHFPNDATHLERARRRLVFDEFFYLQLGLLQRRKQQRQEKTSVVLAPTGQLIEDFYRILPFALTEAQQRVIHEILADLQKSVPMNRLVQGDVGSGKTVVAVVAALAAIQAGYQVTIMTPTEVLAEQHYRKLVSWFNLLHLPVELLTGSTKTSKRRQILQQLSTGELPLLVGTHALLEDPIVFKNLGLVVIDEQHRFGVQQRARLQQKGDHPHVLTMTATPIPRTLALTLHGDLDVSQIDELPPGRQAIRTTVLSAGDRTHAYELMRRQIAEGRQVYVVLPLVEESEKLDLKSAIDEHRRLQDVIFPDLQVGLLHGRLSAAEKDAAITAFRQNQTQILVSTTVVEVGVDVPNATVMLIEHAERFGLSQLHQLRGRVGRGAGQSFCLLMSHSRAETARQRLKVIEQSQDGFFIAEMDMRLRGPGEVLGSRQSGLPDFALASLVEDQEVLELARFAAEEMMVTQASLSPPITKELAYRYQRLLGGSILT